MCGLRRPPDAGAGSSSRYTSLAVAVVMSNSGRAPFQSVRSSIALARSTARSVEPPPITAKGGGERFARASTHWRLPASLVSLYQRTRSRPPCPGRVSTTSGTAVVLSRKARASSTAKPGTCCTPATNRSQVLAAVEVCSQAISWSPSRTASARAGAPRAGSQRPTASSSEAVASPTTTSKIRRERDMFGNGCRGTRKAGRFRLCWSVPIKRTVRQADSRSSPVPRPA